jgi:nucleotide-binding universal stress UspA family protein
VWVTEASWHVTVARAAALLPADAEITLLYVIDAGAAELAEHPGPGRIGRHRPPPDAPVVGAAAEAEAHELLDAAVAALGRPAERLVAQGRVEHEVARACEDADLLVLARDGEDRRGPKSLGHRARFVVDHASCEVLLVWAAPRDAREARPLPPPPPHRHPH